MEVVNLFKNKGYNKAKSYLETELGITVKEYDNIIILNYSQIDSPKYNDIVNECRSLILDKNTYHVLSRSFDRFYNYNEDPNSKSFNFSDMICMEK